MSTSHSKLACFLSVALSLLISCSVNATPISDKDTASAGSWNTGTNWTPNGVPVAGESVFVNHAMTVNADAEFGNAGNMSIWGGASGKNITFAPGGYTLTHVHDNGGFPNAGSIFQLPSTTSDARFQGAGTFLNEGTFQHDSAGVLYMISGPMQFDNSGVIEFTRNNGRIELYDNGTRINNLAGGTVRVNMPNTTHVGRIMGRPDFDGQFIQNGNPFDLVQGVLVYAPPNMVAVDDTEFTDLFGAGANPINGNSEVRFAGGINNITLTGGTKLDRVKLGSSTDAINVRSGGTVVNVSGTGIKTSNVGQVTINAAAGRTFTNQGVLVVDNSSGDFRFNGDGSFDNTGTIQHDNVLFYFGVTGSPTFNNSGTYEFVANGARLSMYLGNSFFNNLPGGNIHVNLPTPTSVARILGQPNGNGQFIQSAGGTGINFTQGILSLAPPGGFGGTLDDTMFQNMVGAGPNPINANSELRLAGGFTAIELTGGSHLDRVRLGSPQDAINVPTGGSSVNVSGTGIRTANGGQVQINTGTGNVLTNEGMLIIDTPTGDVRMTGTGSLDNTGTIEHRNSLMYVNVTAGSNHVNNSGLYKFTTSTGTVNLYFANAAFNNLAGGTLRTEMSTSGGLSQFTHTQGGTATFSNLGTVESTGGILRVASNITMPQMSSTAITGGTWKVLSNAVDAQLDMLGSGASIGTALPYDGSINTIGAGAELVLSQQGAGNALFPQLGSISTLNGSLYVHGSVNLPVGASPMNVSGTLGGDGTYTAVDDIVFSGGVLDPSALDGGAGTLTIDGNLILDDTTELAFGLGTPFVVGSGVNDLIEIDGNLVLDGNLSVTDLGGLSTGVYRLFNYTGTFTNNGVTVADPNYVLDFSTAGQVNLLVVPEPATGLLLLAGCLLLRRKRKS